MWGTLKYNKVFNTRGHTYLTCRLYYQWIIHKYKCLSSLFFSFLKLRERERERECNSSTWEGCRDKQSEGLLSFLTDSFWEHFLLRVSGILYSSAWMRLSSCPRALCRFFTRSLAWDSPICSWRSPSWKLISFIPISANEKGCYFRFRILANHLASFFCQVIHSDYYLFHISEVTGYR